MIGFHGVDPASLPDTVAIVGSRNFPDLAAVRAFVRLLRPDTTVISGGARGVDQAAEAAARSRGLRTVIFAPQRAIIERAGFAAAAKARNRQIVLAAKQGHGVVVAFSLDPVTRGTGHTIRECQRLGVPCILFRVTPEGTWLVESYKERIDDRADVSRHHGR